MKLGISSFGHLVDKALRGKFKSLNELLITSTEACLKFAEKNNIKYVEIMLEPPYVYTSEDKKKFVDLCNSYSAITKQLHGTLTDLSMCSFNEHISEASVKSYIDAAQMCEEIGARVLTVHPGNGHYLITAIRKYNKEQLIKAVHKLLDATANLDVVICIENMDQGAYMLGTENDIEEFLSILNREDIFLTFDTAHATECNMNIELYWEKFHRYVRNIHLAEIGDNETDLHPPLGTGKVNFKKVLNLVKKYDYDGSMFIEIVTGRALRRSIDYIRQFF
ncbi:MAG: sugar phosphate isomerase/epimerase family protein [Promethearchaeota archaeon]